MEKINIHGEWRLIREDTHEIIPVHIPGDHVSALLEAGKIPDPYKEMNEDAVRWVGEKVWVFERDVMLDTAAFDPGSLFLFCDTLDGITEIVINGKKVGETDNAFRRYRFSVNGFMTIGKNTLQIRFLPAGKIAQERAAALPYPLPSIPANKIPHMNTIRAVQCKTGWDWGTCLPVCGIYGKIYIGAVTEGFIEYITTSQRYEENRCTVSVNTDIYSPAGAKKSTLNITFGGQTYNREIQLSPGMNHFQTDFIIDNPRLWWPHEYGEQYLYELVVRAAGDTQTKRIGLRRLELITREDSGGSGLSMKFRIGDREIFCKGANWVPLDAMPRRMTRDKYAFLLESVVNAHMNMLRVWGGGRYEDDVFYDLCDEKGILIWHDFMFACMPYPANTAFLENVREEAKHQLKRLKDHPCIVLWCGDNEVLESFGWFDESKRNPDLYYKNYQELNQGVLAQAVMEYDPDRVFWPGSPSNGPDQARENPQDPDRGDIHYWGVWHKGEPFSAYTRVRPRFCSEFGFQSYPSRACMNLFARPDDMHCDSEVMAFHQRSPGGNETIRRMMAEHFNGVDSLSFEDFCWMSQILQGIGIKTAVEFWRTLRPSCMGTLFWQLNDNWPVISWSSIDYAGRWKILHYYAAHFFAPLLPVLHPDMDNGARVLVVYDLFTPVQGEVRCELFNREGDCLETVKEPVSFDSPGVKEAADLNLSGKGYTKKDVFLYITLETGETRETNTYLPGPLKSYDLKPVPVEVRISKKNNIPVITLSSGRPAFFVTLDSGAINGLFSDNCFTLLPGREREIQFYPADKNTGDRLSEQFKDELRAKALG